MTQPCQHDDQLLDYLYEELSPEEAQRFGAHALSCAHCSREIEKFRRVRTAFHERPAVQLDPLVMQRMNAQVLHQAAQALKASTLSAGESVTAAAPADNGMGKVLPWRKRGPLKVLFHPASGVLAAAAVTLLVVVAKDVGEHRGPQSALAPPASISAMAGPAPASKSELDGEEAARSPGPERQVGAMAQQKAPRKEQAAADKGEAAPAQDAIAAAPQVRAPTTSAKKMGVPAHHAGAKDSSRDDLLDSLLDEPLAKQDRAATGDGLRATEPGRFATPPPPAPPAELARNRPAPSPVREQAQPDNQQGYRNLGPLAYGNQQNGPGAPSQARSQNQAPAAAPAPAPSAANQEAEVAEGKELLKLRAKNAQQEDFDGLMDRRKVTAPQQASQQGGRGIGGTSSGTAGGSQSRGQEQAGPAAQDSAEVMLVHVRELLQKGRCQEASDTLGQLTRKFPGVEVPSSDRSLFQQTCASNQEMDSKLAEKQAPAKPASPSVQMNRSASKSKKAARSPKAADKPAL